MKLEDMEMGAEALKHVKWTRQIAGGKTKDFEVAIKVLTQDEIDRCKINAARRLKDFDTDGDLSTAQDREKFIHDAECAELLAYALRDPEYKDPSQTQAFGGVNAIRSKLLANEIGFLISMYEAHQGEVSPPYAQMTKKQFDDVRRAVVATGSADPLGFFASHVQRAYTVTTALQLDALLTDRSSPGSSSSSEPMNSDEKPASDAAVLSDETESPDAVVLP